MAVGSDTYRSQELRMGQHPYSVAGKSGEECKLQRDAF